MLDETPSWQIRRLDEFAAEVRVPFEPSGNEGRPYVGLEHIEQNTLVLREYGDSAEATSTKREFLNGDVLFGSLRPYFRKVVRPRVDGVCSTDITVVRPVDGAGDSSFLKYFLANRDFIEHASNVATGTRMPRANWKILRASSWRVPPLSTQRKLAAILSAYDDLIENSLRRIEILEEMARNLYYEWFVRFRFPGHERARFVDSPLGRMPEAWPVIRLNSLVSQHIGGGWGKEMRDPEHTERAWVVRGTDLRAARHGDFMSVPLRWHTERNLASRRLVPGDVVLEVSGGSKGQRLGRCLQVTEEWLQPFGGESVICASFCKRVRAATERVAPELLFYGLLAARASGQMSAYEVQSTGISNLQWKRFIEGTKWYLPPRHLQSHFCEFVEALRQQVAILGQRNSTLRTARDLLLPRLVSGEIDVSDLSVRTGPVTTSAPCSRNDVAGYDFFRQIAALPFVDKITLFGSRARGDHEEQSDIDLAVFCDDARDEEWLAVLDCVREDRIDTLVKVDCVRFDRSDAVLQEHVLTEGVVLYERDGER